MLAGVTGASGFVGSALVRHLLQSGHRVRCLTRRQAVAGIPSEDLFQADLTMPAATLERFADGLDVLYHCAGEMTTPARMHAVNVGGVRALLDAAGGRIGRWVQLSSVGVYGPRTGGIVSEETPLAPRGAYESTKAEADLLVLDATARRQLSSYAIVRPSIVFGPGMPNGSLRQLIETIRRGLFFFIGPPGASANYVHVSDVARALVLCGTAGAAHRRIYNVSDWCTVEDVAWAIADALGCPRPARRLPEAPVRWAVRAASRIASLPLTDSRVDALVNRCRYSTERIERELHYAARVRIPRGLADLVAARAAA